MDYKEIVEILKEQVKPAIGCTEPAAVAIAVARAFQEIGGVPEKADVRLSLSVYKNGMRVGIPGTGKTGTPFAVALALVKKDLKIGLEIFKAVSEQDILNAEHFIAENRVNISAVNDEGRFYIEANVYTSTGYAKCVVRDSHTNITLVEKNHVKVYEKDTYAQKQAGSAHSLASLTLKELRKIIETIPYKDIEFLLEGAQLNMQMALEGLKHKNGIGLGVGIQELVQDGIIQMDLVNQVRIYTAAAADARMSGVPLPIMSSAGSGNHGITAIIPPVIVCRKLGYDNEKLARALAFSHLTTIYIKEFSGRLSSICGCSIAAGIGAGVAVAWLIGCNDKQIAETVQNIVGNLSGIVCDGAKGGCAFKVSTAASEAVLSAQIVKKGVFLSENDGIVGCNGELTIKNLGRLCMEGMSNMDETIVDILLSNRC